MRIIPQVLAGDQRRLPARAVRGSALGTSTDASAPQREGRCLMTHLNGVPMTKHTPEPAAQEIAGATAKPPFPDLTTRWAER